MGSKKVTIGYKYFMGMHMVLCRGPINKITRIDVGQRTAWSTDITSSQTIFINQPNLFGGEENEGGVQGNVDIAFGEGTQSINSYLSSKLGSLVSAYRGVVSVILNKCYLSALNPYIKPWAYLANRTTAVPDGEVAWNTAKANVGANDYNPAHMIRELLTFKSYGLNYADSNIGTTFTTVADTLFSEGFGLSFKWGGVTKISDVIRLILTHIDGVMYVDGNTGKFELELIRDDYVASSLVLFDESNIQTIENFEVTTAAENINMVTVNYTNLDNYGKESPITVHNLASIAAGNSIQGEERDYIMITDPNLASEVAFRDLRVLSAPLARIKFKVNRDAWNLVEGRPFRFSWQRFQISEMVMRVVSIKYGTHQNPIITIDAMQDVFSLPLSSYISPESSQWISPNTEPAALTYSRVETASFWDLAQVLNSTDLDARGATDAAMISYGSSEVQDMYEYRIKTSPTGGVGTFEDTGSGDNTGAGQLTAALDKTTTTFSLENATRTALFAVNTNAYVIINDEVMRVDGVASVTGTTLDLTVSRGCMDTIPASHALGDTAFYSGILNDFVGLETFEERLVSENVYTALLPRTTLGTLDPPETYDVLNSLTNREWLPSPPAALTCGTTGVTSYYKTTYTLSSTVEWTWSGRNRLIDIGALIPDTTVASTTEEAGVQYQYEIRNQAAVLRDSGTIVMPATRIVTYDNSVNLDTSLEITLWAERTTPTPTVQSWKTIVHTMTSV